MSTADEVKQRLDVVEVISDYISLQKSGRNYRGLCPFHTEKTPSFFVFPDRQSWRCFGCGVGGDVISFVMKQEGLDFGSALRNLAQRAGVPITDKKAKSQESEQTQKLYRINEAAAQYYHQLLLDSSAARTAREYVKKRELLEETVQEFQLGFSLDEWDALKQHLRGQGYSEKDLVDAGLLVQKENRTYDRFRGRLMFPITDSSGRVTGFGARALDDSQPKYLNSAESPIFSKSHILYGIDRAKEHIRREGKVIIVEGYMDALAAHQNGFRNVVASMGTALTEAQVAMLKGLTTHICLALDPDAAGDAATLRGIEICRQALTQKTRQTPNWLGSSQSSARIDIVSLPAGKDPDQMIREQPDEWQRLSEEAEPLMDYLMAITTQKFDLSRTEGKSHASEQLLPLISEMNDSVEREVYLGKLSQMVGLTERTLAGMAARMQPARKGKAKQPDTRYTSGYGGDRLEEYCLYLLLTYPGLRAMASDISPEHFERSENREIFIAWSACGPPEESENDKDIREHIDAALHEHLQKIIDKEQPALGQKDQEKALTDCINRLETRSIRSRLVYEAECALEESDDSSEKSERLAELQRQYTSFDRQ
ncbi:MAG: DNA primase [Dehalococcoidia bacterium]